MSDSDTCKVAFIGAGYMTSEHLKAFNDVPGVKLGGIYSRTKIRAEKLAQEFGIDHVCDSVDDLFKKTRAELVVISVPELAVREVCLEAFKHPWTCLIEKPAGYDLADAECIAERATALKRRAYVALNRRHHSSTRIVLEDIARQSGPRLIHVYDQEDQIAARKAGQPELVVQNWMYANSIHVVDYLTLLGRGRVVSVDRIIPWTPENPCFVMAKITYDSGDIGIYEAIWNGPGPWAVTVSTQEKRWEMRPVEQASFQPYGSRKLEASAIHEWDTQFKPGLRVQAEEAVKAALGNPHTLPSLDVAMESMRLVSSIYGDGSKECLTGAS
jgi:predicted dehydrogenase